MISITDTQQVPLSLVITDAAGKPAAAPPSPPTWASSDTNIVTVTAAADGMSAVAAAGQVGAATVTVTLLPVAGAPAALTGSIDINVTGGPAVNATVTAGTPVAEPAATPPAAPAA